MSDCPNDDLFMSRIDVNHPEYSIVQQSLSFPLLNTIFLISLFSAWWLMTWYLLTISVSVNTHLYTSIPLAWEYFLFTNWGFSYIAQCWFWSRWLINRFGFHNWLLAEMGRVHRFLLKNDTGSTNIFAKICKPCELDIGNCQIPFPICFHLSSNSKYSWWNTVAYQYYSQCFPDERIHHTNPSHIPVDRMRPIDPCQLRVCQ